MRAKTLNFERGLNPKDAIGVGYERFKKRVIDLLPQIEDEEKKEILKIIEDPTTVIRQDNYPDIGEVFIMALPENRLNTYFFNGFKNYLNSRHPKRLRIHDWGTSEVILYES